MTETPRVMTATPNQPPVDLLSDLLGSMHLSGVVLFSLVLREPWALVTPDASLLPRLLPFLSEHIIPFHNIAEGGCWVELKSMDLHICIGLLLDFQRQRMIG